MDNSQFRLWLEFEEVDPGNWEIENEFANVIVNSPDGRHYGVNVWTFKFLETAIQHDAQESKNKECIYMIPPDLFVKELTRECIYQTIVDQLKKGNLETMLNPSVLVSYGNSMN